MYSYLFRLSGKSLAEMAEELNMRDDKVLEFLCELQKKGVIKEIRFV